MMVRLTQHPRVFKLPFPIAANPLLPSELPTPPIDILINRSLPDPLRPHAAI
ncbi:hypothetical protein N836_26880 [Leptolyngbya sp. Heron Island J]|nr:hypothetical protein N836_26880 [Leptolyngbya sp. Heron Island J]